MIVPIKCVTCGNVLANKYRYYIEQVRKKKMEKGQAVTKVIYYNKDMQHTTTPEAEVMDALKLHNVCCRRVMLTHVDVE
jgi:DNA-directed RNA polymerase I, II, and III subunit RPABC5